MNYQQDSWTDWLSVAEFQYNDKKYVATGYTPFKLNFGRHPQKENLTIRTELSKLNNFLERLQRNWTKRDTDLLGSQKDIGQRAISKQSYQNNG